MTNEVRFNPDIHHRRSIRLQGYDYSQIGTYFITICSNNRDCLFGEITDGKMKKNDAGWMIQSVWDEISIHYRGAETYGFVVMPNHIHGIVLLVGAGPCACPDDGHPQGGAPTVSLPDIVHRFKTMTTKRYTDGVKKYGWAPFPGRLWQRNYWEHIVRNETELNRIRQYIHDNPVQYEWDQLHPRRGEKFFAPTEIREPTTGYGFEAWMV